MLSDQGDYPATTVAGLETNTLWDGLFHAATWIAVAVGIWILWRRTTDWRWAISGRALIGWMLVGWGLFNLVEGIVDHQILGIHHVRETGNNLAWDLAFLAFGALLVLGGWLLARSDESRRRSRVGQRMAPRAYLDHRSRGRDGRGSGGSAGARPRLAPHHRP